MAVESLFGIGIAVAMAVAVTSRMLDPTLTAEPLSDAFCLSSSRMNFACR